MESLKAKISYLRGKTKHSKKGMLALGRCWNRDPAFFLDDTGDLCA